MFGSKRLLVIGVALACLLSPGLPGRGQPADSQLPPGERGASEPAGGSPAGVPAELRDPAFDRFVDLAQVGQTLAAQDPGRLTDLALQMVEGERVLLRP